MPKVRTERESILDKVRKLLGLRGKAEDWAELLPPEGTIQFPGQEGLDPYIATGPGSRGFHQQYMPQPGQQSTLMRNTLGRRTSQSVLDELIERDKRQGRELY
tara:strand:+ start:632 stop:940 length:309 start_codon:yes stop_codon:yes gene_type:complete